MTSNELAVSGNLGLPAVEPSADALDSLVRQAKAMTAAHELGSAMAATAMVPKHFQGKPDDCTAAILYGAELGMNAIQSLQNIMVINGKPGIEARTMVALLKRRGYRIETVASGSDSVTVRGTGPSGETEESTWTLSRATTAGFTSNPLYKKIPEQMLYAKAATEVCRKIAPDVLLGLPYSVEEMRLEPRRVESERVSVPSRGVAGLRDRLVPSGPAQPPTSSETSDEPDPDAGPAPASDSDGGQDSPASKSEINDLLAILAAVGIDGKEPVLAHLSDALGRRITSTGQLSFSEVMSVSEQVLAQTDGPGEDPA